MNPFRKIFLWLSRRGRAQRLLEPPLLPAPMGATFIPHDPGLLERTRMQWMMGDWLSLAAVDADTLEQHPERAKLAAYAGAGLQQLGQHEAAQRLLEQAKEWGCARKLLAEVLLSGVYYTVARAALLAGDGPRALRNLKESIEVGMPGHDVALVARARICAQDQMSGAHLLDWGELEEFGLLEPPKPKCTAEVQAYESDAPGNSGPEVTE